MLFKWHPDQIGGLLSVVLGGIVCIEAMRIQRASGSGFFGDHTLPALLGGLLILLGIVLFFLPERFEPPSQESRFSASLAGSVATMFAYVFLMDTVGYVVSTFCTAIALFRLIGSYSWRACIGYSFVLTAILYLVFVYGLQITFPRGVLW
jgi:putative tricarboxylic transport membrane protein